MFVIVIVFVIALRYERYASFVEEGYKFPAGSINRKTVTKGTPAPRECWVVSLLCSVSSVSGLSVFSVSQQEISVMRDITSRPYLTKHVLETR